MTLTYISCSSDFYTFYVNVPLSLGCMIRKVSAEDIAIRGNGTGMEYMCPTRHFVYIFFNPVFQVSTAKNEINLFNNHVLIVAPVTFAPAGAMTPSAEFLCYLGDMLSGGCELSTTTRENHQEEVLGSATSSLFMPHSCVRSAMLHASETWPLTMPNLQRLQGNDRAMIRQICNVRLQDIVTTRSNELLVLLGIEESDLILKERRLRWYGHVERSNGAVKTAFDIQVDGKSGPGRPKMTWKQLTEGLQRVDQPS